LLSAFENIYIIINLFLYSTNITVPKEFHSLLITWSQKIL